LDEATEGVIYFSLGSFIRGGTLPEEKFQAFIAAFSELPQRIVWKTERNISLPNIKTSAWLSQFEILSKFFSFFRFAPYTCFFETPASSLGSTPRRGSEVSFIFQIHNHFRVTTFFSVVVSIVVTTDF
jgi:hypothetical protein